MNCAKHPEVTAAAFCRTCGKALCETCKREVHGVVYCEDCLAQRVAATLPPQPPTYASTPVRPAGGPHPAVAGVLAGFFPFGVGQAYNGQYARGLVYLLVFIGLIYGADHGGPFEFFFGLATAAFYFFQLIDAIRSARNLQMGMPAPDPFGVDNLLGTGGRPAVEVRPNPAAPVPPASNFPPAGDAAPPVGSVFAAAPPSPAAAPSHEVQEEERHPGVPTGAIILIGLGVLFLLGNLGIFHSVGRVWPFIFIVIGGALLYREWDAITSGTLQGRRHLMGPAMMLTLGVCFIIRVFAHRGFQWPLLLIVLGLVLFWQRAGISAPPPPPMPPVGPGTSVDHPQTGVGETVQAAPEREPER